MEPQVEPPQTLTFSAQGPAVFEEGRKVPFQMDRPLRVTIPEELLPYATSWWNAYPLALYLCPEGYEVPRPDRYVAFAWLKQQDAEVLLIKRTEAWGLRASSEEMEQLKEGIPAGDYTFRLIGGSTWRGATEGRASMEFFEAAAEAAGGEAKSFIAPVAVAASEPAAEEEAAEEATADEEATAAGD